MKNEHPGIRVLTFPEPVLVAMTKATDEGLEEYAARDPLFKEELASQRAFMQSARERTRMSDQYYLEQSEKVFK